MCSAGRGDVAREIWKRFAVANRWKDGCLYEDITPQLRAPQLLLARCAFEQLTDRLLQGPEGWKETHDRMAAWFEDVPALRTRERLELHRNLAAAVDARPAPPGSVEAQLVDWSRRPHTTDDCGLLGPEQLRIVGRGYEAVPELLRLMKDRRVTAHGHHAFVRDPPRITPLGTLAYELACYIAGEHPPPDADGEAALRAWWAKTRRKDEVSALVEASFTGHSNDTPTRQRKLAFLAAFLDDESVRVIPEGSDRFEGSFAAGGIRRMAVRDLATVLLASMLELDYGWSWADIRWAELRARVKERLAKEALPEL